MGEALLVRRGGAAVDVGLFIEPGLIVEFFGLSSTVPEGWALCDGANGTPDLIDKFIIGAGDTYSIGDTGGFVDSTLPSHTHTATFNTNSHNHGFIARSGSFSSIQNANVAGTTPDSNFTITTSSSGAHSHTVSIESSGESNTEKNLPPYLSLFYIIKEDI